MDVTFNNFTTLYDMKTNDLHLTFDMRLNSFVSINWQVTIFQPNSKKKKKKQHLYS